MINKDYILVDKDSFGICCGTKIHCMEYQLQHGVRASTYLVKRF